MRTQSILSTRWLALCAALAVFAFSLGSSEWAGRLFACPGSEGCLGGCMTLYMDGQYADENFCEIVSGNEFPWGQAVFARSSRLTVAGPNVQPVKDGQQVVASTDADITGLGCDYLNIQEATAGSQNTLQMIDGTICPPQT